nr:PREDICTED: malonyl-CoA-acyl carrier protein transacylase, mitochondrial [Latimeria chalumnae]|eukprot:XP_005993749.1 PREDICTED: malonyl-CoA-acyl carrier protein transacylase, mitochondrial [Latimeria chalumnae]
MRFSKCLLPLRRTVQLRVRNARASLTGERVAVEGIEGLLKGAGDEGTQARRKPSNHTVMLFPGQGSQFVGMGKGLLRYEKVRTLYAVAEKVLGYDLLSLCLNGPITELSKTVYCQPAVFVSSLAAIEKLHEENPETIESCVAAAGFSVGEFSALVFAGAMEFAEDDVPSVFTLECGALLAKRKSSALEFLQKNSRKFHFLRAKMVPVSGAFHTSLMEPAAEALADVLKKITIQKPLISVYSNMDAKKYRQPQHIRRLVLKQLVSPVRWEQIMHSVYEREQGTEFPNTYEVGPGKQLGTMLQKCNLKAWRSYKHVDVTAEE